MTKTPILADQLTQRVHEAAKLAIQEEVKAFRGEQKRASLIKAVTAAVIAVLVGPIAAISIWFGVPAFIERSATGLAQQEFNKAMLASPTLDHARNEILEMRRMLWGEMMAVRSMIDTLAHGPTIVIEEDTVELPFSAFKQGDRVGSFEEGECWETAIPLTQTAPPGSVARAWFQGYATTNSAGTGLKFCMLGADLTPDRKNVRVKAGVRRGSSPDWIRVTYQVATSPIGK